MEAVPRAGSWAGVVGCAWALAYVPIHVHWALSGAAQPLGQRPAGLGAQQWRQANWAACVVILGAAAVSLALVRPWGRRLPRRVLLGIAGVGAVFAGLHWVAFSAATALNMVGVSDGEVTSFDRWNLFLLEPWFPGMGVLLAVAAVQFTRRDRDPAAVGTPAGSTRSPAGPAFVVGGTLVVVAG